MQFLQAGLKPKVVRTRLYADQEFTRFELEILHTPMLQRLYGLKQLGFADRVFPDAIHSRFNHVLGVTDVVDRMAHKLLTWLDSHKEVTFEYCVATRDPSPRNEIVTGKQLHAHVGCRMPALRLMALLHDITHGAFGHTLEDEVQVFSEKHDEPARQVRFFNALTAQLLYLWVIEERIHEFDASILEGLSVLNVSSDFKRETAWAEELLARLESGHEQERLTLARHLRQMELAFRHLLRLDFAHCHDHHEPFPEDLLVTRIAEILGRGVEPLTFVFHRDLFMIDLVGNTICADLLDYARRDPENSGLRVQFDDRFLRYLCVVSVKGQYSPTEAPAIRTAIQVFTDKMRHDVLSEISGILKARYIINERVLFHPTKCAAGAMLGTAVQLLGLHDLPYWMQVLGDSEFLARLTQLATALETICPRVAPDAAMGQDLPWSDLVKSTWPVDGNMSELVTAAIRSMLPDIPDRPTSGNVSTILDRTRGARSLLGRLNARRLPKLAYRLRTVHLTAGTNDTTIAATYRNADKRFALEREVEKFCSLPTGSVVVHCPIRKTSMKIAQALVVGSDLKNAAHLREVTEISPEGLEPYQEEIQAVEKMYRSIWQFHAFLDPAYWNKQPIVELAFEKLLGGIPNDRLLSEELFKEQEGPFALLAGEYREEVAPISLPRVIELVDAELVGKMRRFGKDPVNNREMISRIIREVNRERGNSTGNLSAPPNSAYLESSKFVMKSQPARHKILDDVLGRVAGDELNPQKLPLPVRRFMDSYGGNHPVETLQKAVSDLLARYGTVSPTGVPVSVEHLCEILGIRLSGKPPACVTRSHPSYAGDISRSRVGHTGMLRIEKSGPVVVIPDDVDRETAKLAVAHEIGHFLIHWRGHRLDEATLRMPADPIEEALAEYAARLLLLPREIWAGITPITNLAEYAVTQCGLAGVTVNAAVSRLGDPDLSNIDVSGAIFWRMPFGSQNCSLVNERISPHWFRCPGAFIPVNRSKARPGSLAADLAEYEGTAYASRVEDVRIGTFTGTYFVDGYAWGSFEEGRRVVLTIFRSHRQEVQLGTPIASRTPIRPDAPKLAFG